MPSMNHAGRQEGADRRKYTRHNADLGCKLLRPSLARYLAARTDDISCGGAMMTIETTRPLIEGEQIEIGVSWKPSGLIRTRNLVPATVVRATPLLDNRQRIAVAFEQPQAEAESLAAAMAA